jgi:long-chain acyl-CoA synthetase
LKPADTEYVTRTLAGLPCRIHEVIDRYAAETPERLALSEEGNEWSYEKLHRSVSEIAERLRALGIRAGDRMTIVSENCVALAAMLLAASRIDAWAIVVNPRLSARELDLIREHSGARRVLLTVAISKEAEAHATRYGAETRVIARLPISV